MDVSILGVIFIWFAFFWPLIVVSVFSAIKGRSITNIKLFFVTSTVICYLIGILMSFVFPAYLAGITEKALLLLGVQNIKYTMNVVTIIMFGIHIFITYSIYVGFRSKPQAVIKQKKDE